jgi:hypothetical protein
VSVATESLQPLGHSLIFWRESLKYPTPYVSTPLGAPVPRWGARRGPERSGGPCRDPSLEESHPPRCPSPLLGGPARAGAQRRSAPGLESLKTPPHLFFSKKNRNDVMSKNTQYAVLTLHAAWLTD